MKASKLALWLTIAGLGACTTSSSTGTDTDSNEDDSGSATEEETGDEDPGSTGGSTAEETDGDGSTAGPEGSTTEGSEGGTLPTGCEEPWPAGGEFALIDNLEPADGADEPDNAVIAEDGRVGYWYTYVGAGTVEPPNDADYTPSDAESYDGSYSAMLTGTDIEDYAGVGFTLSDNCPYDASAFTGISFWAKGTAVDGGGGESGESEGSGGEESGEGTEGGTAGDTGGEESGSTGGESTFRAAAATGVTVSFSIATPDTIPVEEDGGTCAADCFDNFAFEVELTDEWTEYSITWDELEQAGWGAAAEFDPAYISKFQWQVSGGDPPVTFTIAIDSVSFTPRNASETTTTDGEESDTGDAEESTGGETTGGEESTSSTGDPGEGSDTSDTSG